jgi:hypothetical protein
MAKINPTTGSTKPTTTKKEGKKEKAPKRVAHPLVGSKDPNQYPFKKLPADYKFGEHERLGKDDFEKRSLYWEYRAAGAEADAKRFRELAQTADTKGGTGKLNRFKKMATKLADMKAELAKQGINVEELLAATNAEAKAEKK